MNTAPFVRLLRRHLSAILAAVLSIGVAGAAPPAAVPTRPGVTDTVYPVFVARAKATLILLPGGNGAVAQVRNNFLIRIAPDLQRLGFSTVLVDAPSDKASGMAVSFRLSAEHMQDIAAVVAYAHAQSPAPVWLVGTSNGTVSAALAAAKLGKEIAGVVLTSSVWAQGLGGIPLQDIRVPVLVVHNRDDGCHASPPSGVNLAMPRFTGTPVHDLIWVSGGISRGDDCGAMSPHGYLGIEAGVVSQITDWIQKH